MFEWQGAQIVTLADVYHKGVLRCSDRIAAKSFMKVYRESSAHADLNIAYIILEAFPVRAQSRLWKRFGIIHPTFGKVPPSSRVYQNWKIAEVQAAQDRTVKQLLETYGDANG